MNTILLADDNKSIRQYCKEELEAAGYRVLTARDGAEVLHLLAREEPDLVVLDVRMPRMSGVEAVRHVKSMHCNLPVIFHTAHHKEYVAELGSWPTVPCVEKSANLASLKQLIAAVIGGPQQSQLDLGSCLTLHAAPHAAVVRPEANDFKSRMPPSARILLADPDPLSRGRTCEALRRSGFIVATAADALRCIWLLRNRFNDVLVLDLALPWGGGDGVLAVMGQDSDVPQLPVIAMYPKSVANDNSQRFVQCAYASYVDEYLAKPSSPETLIISIRRLLARRAIIPPLNP